MARWGLIALVAALAGCGGSDRAAQSERPTAVAAGASAKPVLGLVFNGENATLRRLDPLTLRPVGRARVPGLSAGMHAFSPDGRRLALASGDGPPRLRFVDLRTMRRTATVDLPGFGFVTELLWASPKRMLALVGGTQPQIVTLEPSGRVVESRRLAGTIVDLDARAARIVVLLAPAEAIGSAQLAVLDAARGLLGTVTLSEIRAGSERIESAEDSYAMRSINPGVAISPDGSRAVIVSPGSRVAEVDLGSLHVSYHDLSEPVSLLGRLRDWLEPSAQAKVLEGPDRFARFLDGDHVAVTGYDYHGIKDGDWDVSAVGLRLIDTRDWSVRTLAEHVTSLRLEHELLLAYGGNWPEGSTGTGLLAYGAGGEQRFHLLGQQPIGWVETAWPYAYLVHADGQTQRFDVVDLAAGRIVGHPDPARFVSVLGPARSRD